MVVLHLPSLDQLDANAIRVQLASVIVQLLMLAMTCMRSNAHAIGPSHCNYKHKQLVEQLLLINKLLLLLVQLQLLGLMICISAIMSVRIQQHASHSLSIHQEINVSCMIDLVLLQTIIVDLL
jgi:hypothetical protein